MTKQIATLDPPVQKLTDIKTITELRYKPGMPYETRSMPVMPSTFDEETRSFDVTIVTETPVEVIDWDMMEVVDEVLLMSGLKFPDQIPLLDSHLRRSVFNQLGSVRDLRTAGSQAIGKAYCDSTDDGVKAATKVREGHLRDVSGGFSPDVAMWIPENQTAMIDGKSFTGPLKVVTQSTLWEASLTPIGADQAAKVRSARSSSVIFDALVARGLKPNATDEEIEDFLTHQFTARNTQSQINNRKDPTMKTAEELAAEKAAEDQRRAALQQAETEIRAKAEKDAEERITNIYATAQRFAAQYPAVKDMAEKAIKERESVGDFNAKVLSLVGSAPAPVVPPAGQQRNPVISLNSFVKPWERRAVRMLTERVYAARGIHDKATLLRDQITTELNTMNETQKQDEQREAYDKIVNSGIGREQQFRLMSSLTNAAGLYLLPTPLLAEIFVLVEKWGVARRHFRAIPITAGASLKLDSLLTEAVAYWVTEGDKITAADLAFAQGTLTVLKLAGISSWSSELEEDQAIALLPIYTDSIARAIKKKEDLAAFIGDGSGTYGSFTGMLGSAGKVVTMSTGKTATTDATAEDYKALRDAVNIDFRDGAMYFLSPADVSQLEGLKDLQGRFIYREPSGSMPATLWGYPIADNVGINALTLTSAAALKFAAFGNPKYMLMGMKREMELIVSREGILDNGTDVIFNALQADGAIVRMTERVGFKCILTNGISVLKTATT